MSRWRREALKLLPQCKQTIEEAESITWLWMELWHKLRDVYMPLGATNAPLVEGIYRYASWCLNESRDQETLEAVVLHFYENLPRVFADPEMQRDMIRWLTPEDFLKLRDSGVFRYILNTEAEHEAFVQTFQERAGVIKPVPEKPLPPSAFPGISSRHAAR